MFSQECIYVHNFLYVENGFFASSLLGGRKENGKNTH